MKFKDKLKEYREINNITQSDLASKLYISRTLISKWENGVLYPSAENMNKLSILMNEDLNNLLSDDEAKLLVLDSNFKKSYSIIQKVILILSIILVSSGITLLIVGFVFPGDLTRPEDIYNSVNTTTVICFILKIIGAIMTFFGIALPVIICMFKNKK